MRSSELEATRSFWNSAPCGGQPTFERRLAHRYGLEPWIPPLLERIARKHSHVVEIGCGQGTDGIQLCSMLSPNARYEGFDYSEASVLRAIEAARDASSLNVTPVFRGGNAEALDLPDSSVEAIYSCGVLHHTADDLKAFSEVFRVLKPGGRAYIALYRTWAPKVAIAKVLRGIQRAVDRGLRTERALLRLLRGRHGEPLLGTMLLECFGVPYLRGYTARQMRRNFSQFNIISLSSVGFNIPRMARRRDRKPLIGYYWLIEIEKPLSARAPRQ